MNEGKFFTTRNITYLAVLLALVVLLQVFSSFFVIGNASFCLVLVPIVLGGMLLGPWAGAFLGFAFSLVVIFTDILRSPLSMVILQDHPFFLIFSTILRGIAAGLVPAFIFKLVSKKNSRVATFTAAASAPIVNTGIFILSMLIMSGSLIKAMGDEAGGHSAIYVILVMFVGFNFFIELAINLILSPALYTVDKVVMKRISSASPKKEQEDPDVAIDNEDPSNAVTIDNEDPSADEDVESSDEAKKFDGEVPDDKKGDHIDHI